jgi:hypothetical protein
VIDAEKPLVNLRWVEFNVKKYLTQCLTSPPLIGAELLLGGNRTFFPKFYRMAVREIFVLFLED